VRVPAVLFHADIHLLDQLAPFGNFGLDVLAELLGGAADRFGSIRGQSRCDIRLMQKLSQA
jgi:hypothetical protein